MSVGICNYIWLPWNSGLTAATILSLGQDPVSSQTLYAGRYYSPNTLTGLLKSVNGGTSWTEFGNFNSIFGTRGSYIFDITVDPNNVKNGFVSNSSSGINQSIDGGISWSTIEFDTPSVGSYSESVRFDNKNTGILYAHVYSRNLGESVYKSVDNGANWLKSSVGLPVNLASKTLTIDPVNTNVLYISSQYLTPGDLYKSNDSGMTWVGLATGINNIDSLAINPTNTRELYLGTADGKIYKTVNGGTTWAIVASGLTGLPYIGLSVSALQVSPLNSNIIYAGTTGHGLLRSSNYGKDWIPVNISNINSKMIASLRIDYNNDNIVYVGTTGGGTWKIVVTP